MFLHWGNILSFCVLTEMEMTGRLKTVRKQLGVKGTPGEENSAMELNEKYTLSPWHLISSDPLLAIINAGVGAWKEGSKC